jgi:peptide chain release factor 1
MGGISEDFDKFEKRYAELHDMFGAAGVQGKDLANCAREFAFLEKLMPKINGCRKIAREIEGAKALLASDDKEMRGLAAQELERLQKSIDALEEEIRGIISPGEGDKNVIMEIRAGTGGEESALFASDLYRMYTRYIERKKWKSEALSSHPIGIGGFKEIIFRIEGKGAYRNLKFESGVHRVQRVPVTEASGRIHTSTATVAVLPEVEDVEIEIKPEEIRLDTYRSSGPGGQAMQKTDSAVRITHIPTGIVVSCQDERSQIKNKLQAMSILRAKLYSMKEQEQHDSISKERRSQVGTGERSEKIRTYNYPQNRVTDHRINKSVHNLTEIMEGGLDEFIEALVKNLK